MLDEAFKKEFIFILNQSDAVKFLCSKLVFHGRQLGL
jgi:hypothetical protein